MAMSPRLLRPRATGFNPRSISGLALWLDAADSASLYTTDAGPVTAVTDPRDIAGCVLWLDGADASTVTASGGSVSEWRDKTSGARHFTASSTAQPTYTATLNGRNVLTFNGSTNTMTGNAAAQDVIRNRAGYTFFAVSKVGSVAAGERLLCGFGATVIFRAGQNGSSPYAGGRRVSGDTLKNITGAASSLAVGSSYITSAIVNHTAQSLTGNLNGSGFASDTTYMAAGSSENTAMTASLGSQSSAYGFYNGDIAEVIIFDTALSATDRARVEAYLAAKWGISGVHTPATATNDPVGAWLDKSGNNRHATQATAVRRPVVGSQNNRKALAFDGSDDNVSLTPSSPIGASGFTTIAAIRNNLTSQPLYLAPPCSLSAGNQGRPIERWQGGISQSIVTIGLVTSNVGGSYRSFSDRVVYGLDALKDGISSGTHQVREFLNGATNFDTQNNGSWVIASQRINVGTRDDGNTQYKGDICEVCVYDRRLSTAERQRIERYLASKWGITLAPQVSNAEAQDWINRVYANGGTVSATTAAAVNSFCDAIDAAGIRDRFYRLNLFAGTSLNAALVPLYRNTSLAGSPLGNTTDTNAGSLFVSGDYAETAGLTAGAATAKYLDTGLASSALPAGVIDSGHLSAWHGPVSGPDTDPTLVGAINGAIDRKSISLSIRNGSAGADIGRWGKTTVVNPATGIQGARASTFVLAQRTSATNLEFWRNTSLAGTNSTSATGIAGVTFPFFVFRVNSSGTASGDQPGTTLRHYSIGDDLTSSQIPSFYNALAAFNTALGRTA